MIKMLQLDYDTVAISSAVGLAVESRWSQFSTWVRSCDGKRDEIPTNNSSI